MWSQRERKRGGGNGDGEDLEYEELSGDAPNIDDVLEEVDEAEKKAAELEEQERREREYDDCCFCGC